MTASLSKVGCGFGGGASEGGCDFTQAESDGSKGPGGEPGDAREHVD